MQAIFVASGLLALAGLGLAQAPPPAPTDGRVSNRNIVLLTKDPELQHHLWVDIMGATVGQSSPNRTFYILPKVVVIVEKGNPTAGTEGSIVNHVGFRVRDIKDILAKVEAQHFTVQVVNPNRDNPNQIFFVGPDNLRVELLAGPNLTTVAENHQVHFFTPDIDGMSKWYIDHFGATPQSFGKVKLANLPGVTLIFSPTETAVTGTKGRALDHISLEVKDLESFLKDLEASGVKLDTPYRKIPQTGMGVAFLTDPWGTRVELTEHPAPATSAAQ